MAAPNPPAIALLTGFVARFVQTSATPGPSQDSSVFPRPDQTMRSRDDQQKSFVLFGGARRRTRISERLESEPDPLSPATAAAIVRALMHI
jgi:hypothetical protein